MSGIPSSNPLYPYFNILGGTQHGGWPIWTLTSPQDRARRHSRYPFPREPLRPLPVRGWAFPP